MVTRRTLLTAALAAGLLPKASLAATRIRMGELYNHDGSFSPRADELKGTRIAMQGFMAPHLKVDSDFFILSNTPVETCPFCASEGEWIELDRVCAHARQAGDGCAWDTHSGAGNA